MKANLRQHPWWLALFGCLLCLGLTMPALHQPSMTPPTDPDEGVTARLTVIQEVHDTLGPSGCSCHLDQQTWWYEDQHNLSAEKIIDEEARAVEIATAYGISTEAMKLGNSICMSCHGTVITGEESEEVFDGVSCESCHGPGGDYAATHPVQKYEGSIEMGMLNLEQADVRAQNCARCHHITDAKLLAAGHTSGDDFNITVRNKQIIHWVEPLLSDEVLTEAYHKVIEAQE